MTQYDQEHIQRWLARSLQSYVYWAGFKSIQVRGTRTHEVVRQDQLKEIMEKHLRRNFRVLESPAYQTISPQALQAVRWRGDLAVRLRRWDVDKGATFHTRYLFELKFEDADSEEFDWDLYKLARLSQAKREREQDCRSFLLILGIGEPDARFAYTGQPCTVDSKQTPTLRFSHVTRGVFTAAPVGAEEEGHYACLVEVIA